MFRFLLDTSLVLIITFHGLYPPFTAYFTEQRNTFIEQIGMGLLRPLPIRNVYALK